MEQYRAVGKRCAVLLSDLALNFSEREILDLLQQEGFRLIAVSLSWLARQWVGRASFQLNANPLQAPEVTNCSLFTRWLYAQKGIWLPQHAIQQRDYGTSVDLTHIQEGDLVFTSGPTAYYREHPEDAIGHVGMVTDRGTVIQATNLTTDHAGVVETGIENTLERGFRGARRILVPGTITILVPVRHDVETPDDLRWIILRSWAKFGLVGH
jgi:hypothetical protein